MCRRWYVPMIVSFIHSVENKGWYLRFLGCKIFFPSVKFYIWKKIDLVLVTQNISMSLLKLGVGLLYDLVYVTMMKSSNQ